MMRKLAFAAAALIALAVARPAFADGTGTVGPLGIGNFKGAMFVYFKFTDATITQACTNNNIVTTGYAYVYLGNAGQLNNVSGSNELMALLLTSKKGSTIKCYFSTPDCNVQQCELQ